MRDGWFLRLTQFGWVVSGVAPQKAILKKDSFVGCTLQEIDKNLRRFWENEEVDQKCKSANEEVSMLVKHFEDTHSIGADGKFVVKLPFKIDASAVASNCSRAMVALFKMERSLNEELKTKYSAFLQAYFDMGHMSVAERTAGHQYFIPHRQVLRTESLTTSLLVVLNVSSCSKGPNSPNSVLMFKANIQRDLFDILISMRSFQFCYVADIEKMYRMIWVHKNDRDMQRILWRKSPEEPVCE